MLSLLQNFFPQGKESVLYKTKPNIAAYNFSVAKSFSQ